MPHRPALEKIYRKYDFQWSAIEMILEGRSIIDSYDGFGLRSLDQVDRFLAGYGMDFSNPIERAEAMGMFQEAVSFIRRYFLKPENPDGYAGDIPRRILEISDIRDLFLYGSGSYPGQRADGAGAVLKDFAIAIIKVMHAIVHADKDLRVMYFGDIQKQILDLHYRSLYRTTSDSRLYLGDPEKDPHAVPLVQFETKPKKTRDSVLIKLLHKPETIAEDIFDRLGVRYVTKTRLDALRVLRFLNEKLIILPANLKITRSKNTLVDISLMREAISKNLRRVFKGELDENGFVQEIEKLEHRIEKNNPNNPHSSQYYRAIQLTSRQLIKFKNSLYDDIRELKALTKKKPISEEYQKLIDRLDPKQIQKEVTFFYPYEIQIVDQKSFEENERGRSAHSEYKKQQIQTAMQRVMGPIIRGTG